MDGWLEKDKKYDTEIKMEQLIISINTADSIFVGSLSLAASH